MERDLKQGDPLSHFLFLIVTEALQVLTLEACNKGVYKGLSLAKDGANVSLLQYADDALFLSRLSSWKSNLMSIGGRLTLVKAVLGSMPLYHLSLFRAPIKIIKRLEAI
ncbi:hypothetical protein Tco_1001575 [Tanacetum coccineum]